MAAALPLPPDAPPPATVTIRELAPTPVAGAMRSGTDPAGQPTHAVPSPLLVAPKPQAEQTAADVAPSARDQVPAGQATQLSGERCAADAGWYRPGAHLVQPRSPTEEKVPAAQDVQPLTGS